MNDLPQNTDTGAPANQTPFDPRDWEQLVAFSKHVVQSRLCPDHIESPEDVTLIVHQGATLGLDPMTALQNSHVIHGQVGYDADMLKALCLETGEVERWDYERKDGEACIVVVQRTGMSPTEYEWTIDQARQAGLTDSHVWSSYPAQMLRHRADAEAARAEFPDVVAGIYTPSEEPDAADAVHGEGVEVVDSEPADPTPEPQPGDRSDLDDAFDPDDSAADDPSPDLSDLRQQVGLLIDDVDRPDGAGGAFTDALRQRGTWHDVERLEACLEQLQSVTADDRLKMMRSVVDSTDGVDWPDPSDDSDDSGWTDLSVGQRITRLGEEGGGDIQAAIGAAESDEQAYHAMRQWADDQGCEVDELPEVGLPDEVTDQLSSPSSAFSAVKSAADAAQGEIPF